MFDADTVYLKVTISRDVNRRLKAFVSNKYPDFLRGPLSKEVEKAIIYYLDSKEKVIVVEHAHAHIETKQHQHQHQQSNTNNRKYDKLVETIKRYSNSNRQITSGLAKKAIQQTIGKDERTVNKYLKILQDDDVIYGDSLGGLYDVQSWVFNDYNLDLVKQQQQDQHQQGARM